MIAGSGAVNNASRKSYRLEASSTNFNGTGTGLLLQLEYDTGEQEHA